MAYCPLGKCINCISTKQEIFHQSNFFWRTPHQDPSDANWSEKLRVGDNFNYYRPAAVFLPIVGQRHWIRPSSPSSTPVRLATDRVLLELNKVLHVPICLSLTPWNVRSEYVRTRESPVGNWVSDCLFTEYQKVLSHLMQLFHIMLYDLYSFWQKRKPPTAIL